MACGACAKNRARREAAAAAANGGKAPVSGTYRVMVKGRQAYESSQRGPAETVAARYVDAIVLAPGESL